MMIECWVLDSVGKAAILLEGNMGIQTNRPLYWKETSHLTKTQGNQSINQWNN